MYFVTPIIVASLLASAAAAPTVSSSARRSAPTPVGVLPPPPKFLPFHIMARSFPELGPEHVAAFNTRDFEEERGLLARDVGADMLHNAKHVRDFSTGQLAPRELVAEAKSHIRRTASTRCLDSTTNATYISSLFWYGGAGTTVVLCKNAVINLNDTIWFNGANQTLMTAGNPTGATRATLIVTGADQSCAIYGANKGDNIAIRNIQIDGSRETMGLISGGSALIEMGGTNSGQIIDQVHAFEPRGWSCLHAIEGYQNSCTGMKITRNQIGPSGHAPSGAAQFRKRDNTGTYAPGQWADGISLACANSEVSGNMIMDATDGGIVIFGAPGSLVTGNTIKAVNRQLLGGINMVDWSPFSGTFEGTVVSNNEIISQRSMIKLGVAMGGMTWGVDNRTASRTFGGTVINNTFTSGPAGYFGYAIGMAGHENATVQGNDASGANFGGVESPSCFPAYPLPAPQAYTADEWTTPGKDVQTGFSLSTLVLLICRGPGKITSRAVS